MKKISAFALVALAAWITFLHAGAYAGVFITLVMLALLTPLTARNLGMCRVNAIDASLNLDVILDSSIKAFQRTMAPILTLATVFRNVQLKGTNIVRVPYYPLENSPSKDFNYGDGYVFDGNTNTASRPVTINKRKYQDLSITSEEIARFPALNAQELGEQKGTKLAYDVLQDVFSIVTAANYPQVCFTGVASGFDSDDIADIRGQCNSNRTGPASVTDGATTSGSATITSATASFELSDIGISVTGSGIPADTVIAAYTNATTVVLSQNATASAGGVTLTLDRPKIAWPKAMRGLIVSPDYDTHLMKDTAVKAAYALGSDSVITRADLPQIMGFSYSETDSIPDNGESLVGMATYMSAILAAFSPIPPAPAVRQVMVDYQIADLNGMSIEYRHFGDPQMDTERRIIECNYGYAVGERQAIKRMKSA